MMPVSVTYEWEWAADDSTAPRGLAVERSPETDTTQVAITTLKVTVYPGTDEPASVNATGRVLTKAGVVDKRHSYSQPVWLTEAIIELAGLLLNEARAVVA